MAEQGTNKTEEEKAAEAAAEAKAAEDSAAAAAAVEGTDEEKAAAAEAAKTEEEAKAAKVVEAAKEKKFTDKDMKDTRLKYQGETRAERDARIAAETEARVLREVLDGKKVSGEEKKSTPTERPVRPVEGDFATREEFNKSMDEYEDKAYEWRSAQRDADESARKADERRRSSQTELQRSVSKNIEEGKKLYEDFEDVVVNSPDMVATPMMTVAIVKMPNAPDVAYYIGKNPAEGRRLAEIGDPIDLALAMREISDKLKEGKKPTVPAKPAAAATKAPLPAATVAAKSKVSTDSSLEGKTQAERMRLMEERSRQNRSSGRWREN